ncbi:Retrovirus-related Pol polyprotein from transposon, partial [Smittium culicis]
PRGRIARWNSALQAYDFTVKHVKGLDNTLTDALSRDLEDTDTDVCKMHLSITRSRNIDDSPLNTSDSAQTDYYDPTDPDFNRVVDPIPRTTTTAENDTDQTLQEYNISEYLPSRTDFTKMQQIDPKIKEILTTLNNVDSASTHLAKQSESYCLKNSMLYNVSNPDCPRLYVPAALIKAVIYHHHDTSIMSHLGHRRTLDKIKQTFFWPKMSRDVFGYIQSCRICQLTKHSTLQTPGDLQPIHVSEPFELVIIDHTGPFTTIDNGNKYILVITDLLTRWVDAIAVPNTTAETTVDALERRMIIPHGCPIKLLSDNGPAFTSQLMEMFCYKYGIKQLSPIRASIQHINQIAEKPMQHRYNARHPATTYQITVYVLLKRHTADELNHSHGLSSAYIGPYQVIGKIDRVSHSLELIDEDGYRNRTTSHINRLKPFHERATAAIFSMGGGRMILRQVLESANHSDAMIALANTKSLSIHSAQLTS